MYLVRRGRTHGTRVKYAHALGLFAVWGASRPPGSVKPDEIDRYLALWRDRFLARHDREPSRATYRGQIAALRAFYGWLELFDLLRDGEGVVAPNPMLRIVAPQPEQRANDWLQPAEDEALLKADGTQRECLTVWLLRWTGLRVGEATGLRLRDIDLTPGRESVIIRQSKTAAGRRSVAIVPELLPRIEACLEQLERDGLNRPDGPLLATRSGAPMRNSYVWRLVKRMAFRAGVRVLPCTCASTRCRTHGPGCPRTKSGENLSNVSPHTLRRTFGSDLLNRGLRLEVVSKLLGHASTSITERAYAELLDETVRRELFDVLAR